MKYPTMKLQQMHHDIYDKFTEKYPDLEKQVVSYRGIDGSGEHIEIMLEGDIHIIYSKTQNKIIDLESNECPHYIKDLYMLNLK